MPDTSTPSSGAAIPEAIAPQSAGGRPEAALPPDRSGRHAFLVAAGILLSRVVGLVRQRVFAHYFGNSLAAAAFSAALRIPNYLQNLFGEGVLSASFIPVYAELVGKKDRDTADKVAGAVFGLLALVTAVLVATGVLLTPWLVDLLAPGMEGEGRQLAITLVRIIFPGTGLLVCSAWCLGILNSHRKFFLSYAAPVLWNGAIILALVVFGGESSQSQLAVYVAWAVVVGSALQFLVQLPKVLGLLGRFRPSLSLALPQVRQVLKSFGPVVIGRGVVQVSAYVDLVYASLISARAIAALSYAQTIYLVPVSLFGMAVSAAELPAMAQTDQVGDARADALRERVSNGLARIAFFVVPSSAAFLLLGDVVAGALLQTGKFSAADTRYVWFILMGSTVGLLAATMGRLYASAFYALKDTRTPLYFAAVRVALGAVLAYFAVRMAPTLLGIPEEMGAAGITVASGLAAWVEFLLLRRTLGARIGQPRLPAHRLPVLWSCAGLAGGVGLLIKWRVTAWRGPDSGVFAQWGASFLLPPSLHPILTGLVVLIPFGVVYFLMAKVFKIPQAQVLVRRVLRQRS